MKNSVQILIISFFISSSLYCQEKEAKFEIKFYKDRGSLGMVCSNGCSWSNLFVKENGFYLNQFGMVNYNQNSEAEQNSTFLFSVRKINNKIYLKSYKGTRWKELSFSLRKGKNNPIIVDEIKVHN